MSANIFGQPSCLNQDQADVLADIGLNLDPVSPTDSCKNKNSCGKTVSELLEEYSFYSPQRGIYKSWGDIDFPWEIIDGITPNLLSSETDDKWSVARYRTYYAYRQGDRVLYIEDDGYILSLYEANQDIISFPGPLDRTKWDKVCSVETTIPVGILTAEELKERYLYFNFEYFFDEWEEMDSTWSNPLYQQSLSQCNTPGISIEDYEKCLKDQSSDVWQEARIRKEFFYRSGDYFIVDGVCEDTVCLYSIIKDLPATKENYDKYIDFYKTPESEYWEKLYCVKTGRNKCLEPQRKRGLDNYQLIQLGTEGHYAEQPIPYYNLKGNQFCQEPETLNEYAEIIAPVVLTQEEIDALEQS